MLRAGHALYMASGVVLQAVRLQCFMFGAGSALIGAAVASPSHDGTAVVIFYVHAVDLSIVFTSHDVLVLVALP